MPHVLVECSWILHCTKYNKHFVVLSTLANDFGILVHESYTIKMYQLYDR